MADPRPWLFSLPRDKADQALVTALVGLHCNLIQDEWTDRWLAILARAEPLCSASTRMENLRAAARAVLEAAPHRLRPGGTWARAQMDLGAALHRDALARIGGILQ